MMTWLSLNRTASAGTSKCSAAKSISRPLMVSRGGEGGGAVQVGPGGRGRGRGVGDLAGGGRGDPDLVRVDLQLLGDDLLDLDHQPLAHLGAAVIELHRGRRYRRAAERACLVQMGDREGDAELHRRQGEALLEDAILGIEVRNRLPTLARRSSRWFRVRRSARAGCCR